MGADRAVVKGVRYFLAHTPGLVRHGSKPAREIPKHPDLLARIRAHVRSYAAALTYPPNQASRRRRIGLPPPGHSRLRGAHGFSPRHLPPASCVLRGDVGDAGSFCPGAVAAPCGWAADVWTAHSAGRPALGSLCVKGS